MWKFIICIHVNCIKVHVPRFYGNFKYHYKFLSKFQIHFATSPHNRVSIVSLINVLAISLYVKNTAGIRPRVNKCDYNVAILWIRSSDALIENKYLYIHNYLYKIHIVWSCIIGVSFPGFACVDSSLYYVIQTSQTGHVSYSSMSIGSA